MAFPTKVCLIAGAGCIASVAVGLSQARSSLSIKERLSLDGYVLISSKEGEIVEQAWKDRATIYKTDSKNTDLLFNDLPQEDVNEKGDQIKEKCNKFTDGRATMNSINDNIYEKITKLCALNIKEYIKSHLSSGEEIIEKTGKDDEWTKKFTEHKERITKEIEGIDDSNAKTKLPEWCEKTYELPKSNANSSKSSDANYWCVKKPTPPAKPKPTDSDSGTEEGDD